jgi:hypothetical protein
MMRTSVVVLAAVLCLPGVAGAAFDVPPYEPLRVQAKVPAYQVAPDLSNIINLGQFGELTPRQQELLARNAFFVSPTEDKQLYFVYEDNDYLVIPSFIACDAVLQLYHLFYDYSLREVEAERLIPLCEQLTRHMLARSVSMYQELPPGDVQAAALRNVAYFGVAAKLLGLSMYVPASAADMVDEELATIAKHEGRRPSAIFPYKFDFSQFVPRGHYTRSDLLGRYFKAMMWYGLVPLALEWPERERPPVIAYEQIRQSLLVTWILYETKLDGRPAIETWERVYEPTAFYVEFSDDLTPAEWRAAAEATWGHLPAARELAGKSKIDSFHDRAMAIRAPRIATFPGKTDPLEQIEGIPTGPQFRFMGQRSVPDSYVLQQLVWSNVGTLENQRRRPLGLDVFAALGSERAYHHLKQLGEREYARYDEQMAKLRSELAGKTGEDWRKNLYWGWVWLLKGLAEPFGEGHPSFMRNDAWLDKELSTALASWVEMRHDTILYAKQSVTAECGDGEEPEQPPIPKGYVEPVAEVYHRLLWLTQATRKGLRDRELLTPALDESFGDMEDLLVFLERVSVKELADEPLKAVEYDQIRVLDAQIEQITSQLTLGVSEESGYLISEADEDMAVVADVHSDLRLEKCLEEAVGHADHIFVVVPVGGKLYLTRGSVFSYYEFAQSIRDRLTDEKWQEWLETGKAPARPEWTSSFRGDAKSDVPVPDLTRSVKMWGGC